MPVLKINKPYTIHTSRTIMFKELSNLISQKVFTENQIQAQNTVYKATSSNIKKTIGFLSKLYDFKEQNILWKVFIYLWNKADDNERRIITLLYALKKDDLLLLSAPFVLKANIGNTYNSKPFHKLFEDNFKNKYTIESIEASSRRLLSSWSQAGYFRGKYKKIRIPVNPGFIAVTFALFLGYVEGQRGEELVKTEWIKVFELTEIEIRELMSEASIRDLILYNYAGGVTVIRFDKLINAIK